MAGNAGNAGNVGNAGGVGAVNVGSMNVVVLPDRVDLPFVSTVSDQPETRTTQAGGAPIELIRIHDFPEGAWAGEWRAWYALSQYARTDWTSITVQPWVDTDESVSSEIEQLVNDAKSERADALAEIVAQDQEFASYFLGLLTMQATGFPATCSLLDMASIVATFTVLHFKAGAPPDPGRNYPGYSPRPRPSHVYPALLPAIRAPGHPSYPSGHATEAHLIELVLNDVLEGSPQKDVISRALSALASRIARNREIAGLHYRSDSEAGRKLAEDILPYLQSIDAYQARLPAARTEWQGGAS